MLISFEQAFSWLKFAYAILLLVDLLFLTSYWMMYLDIDDMEEEIEEEEEASTFQAGDGKVFTDRLVFLFFVLIQGYIYKKYCGLWGEGGFIDRYAQYIDHIDFRECSCHIFFYEYA